MGPTSTSTITETYPSSTGACTKQVWPEGPGDLHTGPVTTACDGIPRALGPLEYLTSYWPGTGPCSTIMLSSTWTTPIYRLPSSSPTCQLNVQDCIPIWQTYNSLFNAYVESVTVEIPGDTNSPIRPVNCPSTRQTEQDPCTNCHYLPGTATLFYWPVSTTSGDLCLQNGSTITATPTGDGPNTAIVDSYTFTSPSIYVSFTSIYARGNNRKYPGGSGGAQCSVGGMACDMIRNDYLPWMGIPEGVMTQIDPRWTECSRLWYIPPVSLVSLGVGAMESRPTGMAEASIPQAASASPVSALVAPTPESTNDH
ncbi:conserved hypothetical protein [Aspergillus terreus NIH2624]|uniref:Uncharacterized protein n=1 Tax=Aspergillus terreus (strain NIH 2624 / FGSC A1156) TaxID=341663 RepID=Q0CKY7_ASPTN|nr:uncharacterized protein ATEG_05647 [Aspergillus terreus NIH2624]EAU33408.1 conserved hypothetical protein [Aspergillus terreus NIH2624]